MKNLTIVIPVFNALSETKRCIHSILNSDAKDASLLLINDGSLSGVQSALLDEFGSVENISIFESFRNRGYTASVQFGLENTNTKYLCILNSDTMVPKVWASKLIRHLDDNHFVAGVGPVSNAASYQSVPLVKGDGGFSTNDNLGEDEAGLENVNRVLSTFSKNSFVSVPILNGFCTIFRTRSLLQIGGFDRKSFPVGYGEENDVCIRLLGEGFLLGVSIDVFVFHEKSKSFGTERKKKLSKEGRATLDVKFGSNMLSDLSAKLKSCSELDLLRLWLSFVFDLEDVNVLTNSKAKTLKENKLYTFEGPLQLNISAKGKLLVSQSDSEAFQVSGSTDAIDVVVPKGRTFSIVSDSPIESALVNLAYESYFEVVSLTDWSGAFNSLEDTNQFKMPFKMLSLNEVEN
ncbi:MAG: glycosyltransferase [Maricaulaceae bacterium]